MAIAIQLVGVLFLAILITRLAGVYPAAQRRCWNVVPHAFGWASIR